MFMVYDKQAADSELSLLPQVPAKDDKGEDILRNGNPYPESRNHRYIGVRTGNIRNAVARDTRLPLIGYTDDRFPSMLSALVKLKLIKKSRWSGKKWVKDRYYYTLTKDGETIWGEIEKYKKTTMSKLLFCLKDLDRGFVGRDDRLVEKFGLILEIDDVDPD